MSFINGTNLNGEDFPIEIILLTAVIAGITIASFIIYGIGG